MRRCRETEYNEYISLCYHSPCYRGFFLVSTILVIQDISASTYHWLQVCSPSQPVLCGILHLTELKDGEIVLSRLSKCFSCLLDLTTLDHASYSTLYNLSKLTFIIWEYSVILGVITYSGSIIMLLKFDHFKPAVGWLGLIFKVTWICRGLRKSVNSIGHNFTGMHIHTHPDPCGTQVQCWQWWSTFSKVETNPVGITYLTETRLNKNWTQWNWPLIEIH